MSKITKRTWKTARGEQRVGWSLHYVDGDGKQRRKLFTLKRDADAERTRIDGELAAGTYISSDGSVTVLEAAKQFLTDYQKLVDAGKRERSTLLGYQQHVDWHLESFGIAAVMLSKLKGPDCTKYARELEESRSDTMARRVFGTFRRVLDFAVSNGWIASNVASSVGIRTSGSRLEEPKIEFPTKKQLRALLQAAKHQDSTGKCYAMICVLVFAGLRASEMRGLLWSNIDLKNNRISVAQRADRWQRIGSVKTKNSRRTIPIPASAVSALRKWWVASKPSSDNLVFPTGAGNPESYPNIYNRIWRPLMKDAGLAKIKKCSDTEKVEPYFGLHMLRHVACSLWIEQGAKGQRVKAWAGHAKIQFTYDVYGHLWEDEASDQAIAEAVEKSLGAA